MSLFDPGNNTLSALLITALLFLLPQSLFAGIEINCNSNFVVPHPTQLVIDISPTGTDDTVNIQCALDAAVEQGIPVVRLAKGDFTISNLQIVNFKGSLQGTTRADTHLAIMDNSIDCAAFVNESRRTAAIIFVGGEPRLKFMTIISGQPCIQETKILSIVHFTGASRADLSCKNDVIFAVVDRVDLIGPERSGTLTQAAIEASAEGWSSSGSCKNTLLGTFKLNQSSITGYDIGVLSTMRASAQVDFNFNTFVNTYRGIWLVDSNQSTTITGNTFTSENNNEDLNGIGAIEIGTRTNTAPVKTRVVVHNNQFTFSDAVGVSSNFFRGAAITSNFSGNLQDVSLSITDNRFQLLGDNRFIIHLRDINNAVVSANKFAGDVATGVSIAGAKAAAVSGCLIVSNIVNTLTSEHQDIFLDEKTTHCIVGPGQDANVVDLGVDNSIL